MSGPTYRCASCGQPIRLYGSSLRFVNGLQRQRVGKCCAKPLGPQSQPRKGVQP